MDRRKFIQTTALALGGTILTRDILTAKVRSRLGANDVREIPINLIDTPELKPVGGTYHLEVEDLQRDILVVHQAENTFIAVDIKCKHRGCDVGYDTDAKKFVCPCHGSEYDLGGRVLKGPTTASLSYYHAELKGDEVLVTVYGANDPVPANSIPPAVTLHPAVEKLNAKDSIVVDSLANHQ